jgi:hypothetical protein
MVFRVLEYVLQIYKRQLRDWQPEYGSLDEFHFQPVLPVVLYSGTRAWDRLAGFAELLEARGAGRADAGVPTAVPEREPGQRGDAGDAGRRLRPAAAVGTQRRLRRTVFEATLRQVVRALEEQLAEEDRARWLELLSYLSALIDHEREEPEREPMRRLVEDAVQEDRHRREVFDMGKTIAEALKEEGAAREAVRGRQQTLLRQLRLRFKRLPEGTVKRVENTTEVAQLDAWLDAFANARKLADVRSRP